MPDRVLIYSRFPKALMLRIGERFELLDAAGKPPAEVFSAEQLSGIRAMITAGGTQLPGRVMDMLPKLAAIICYGTGYDGVDLAAARERHIAVGNSPGANAASVADLAVTLMLTATRRIVPADGFVRDGSWAASKPSPLLRAVPGNPGRRVGIYGMGEIGRKIAARLSAFEMEIGYFSRSRREVPYRYLRKPGGAGRMVQCADDRSARQRRHPSRRQCRYPQKTRQRRLCHQYRARLGDRRGGPGCRSEGQYHCRRRPRRVREGTASAR